MAGFGLGGNEILIIVLAAGLLFLGGKKIPELAKGLGRAMGEFQRGRKEVEKELGLPLPGERKVRRLKAKAGPPGDGPQQESRVVKAARALGIETGGKSEEELKQEIAKIAGL